MADPEVHSYGAQPSKQQQSSNGHPLPRRTSPAKSVTLHHHRLARDASLRASPGDSDPIVPTNSTSSRRQSSGESHHTGQSDPKKWFDSSNQNATATFDNIVMDVDPPFFQKESDSSNEDKPYVHQVHAASSRPRLNTAPSSSADDYRSVIDDLTVEIQKLKEELKRYKQNGPDTLRKEKLFEIKIHGLPKKKKRELEAALRDFTAGLEGVVDTSSSQRNSKHATREHKSSGSGSQSNMYSASGSNSKHALSSSGSNARPVDSAYASMSTGAHSSDTSLGRPSTSSRTKTSEQKVENYLRDIPSGLYPQHTAAMTEKDKKKLVVRRLEQLFTGKITGRGSRHDPQLPSADLAAAPLIVAEAQFEPRHLAVQLPLAALADREAKILPLDQQPNRLTRNNGSRDMELTSTSYGYQPESGTSGHIGTGTNISPLTSELPEQRPTRPKDLDPDRAQVPSENMDYIRHLGLVPPELLAESSPNPHDVNPDADGWVYLNLLCSLAQLHIINVTPDFVRIAVSEISTKFQLSPDGRKIRWRGGTEGTKFNSDSSGNNSQRSPEMEDTDAEKDDARKRLKTKHSTGDGTLTGSSGNHEAKFGPQFLASSDSFHYKPLFVRPESPTRQVSVDGTLSSSAPVNESNFGSRWDPSGSSMSPRKKRRRDGAIIYYSGAPFCTDLSGDSGDVSPTTYMLSSGQGPTHSTQFARPLPYRSESGSSLAFRPLSGKNRPDSQINVGGSAKDVATKSDDGSSELDLDLPWSGDDQYMEVRPLEPCGLGGVLPEDHFMVVVTTKRPKEVPTSSIQSVSTLPDSEKATKAIIDRLAARSASSPSSAPPTVGIEYVSGRIKRLAPVSLPPPAIFYPPFSNGSSSTTDEFESEEDSHEVQSEAFNTSRFANPHRSDGYPDGVDLTSGDEDGEDPDEEPDARRMYERRNDSSELILPQRRRASQRLSFSSADAAPGTARERSKSGSAMALRTDRSSIATAGGVGSGGSGYSSSSRVG